jgi:hypothetical protein
MKVDEARHLELSASDRSLLAGVWEGAGRPSLRVDPADVEAASKAVRSAIPDLILAILIAEGRTPFDLVALTRELVEYYWVNEVHKWRLATKFDHVAFARLTPDDSPEPEFACFARTKRPTKIRIVAWNIRKPEPGGEPLADVGAYMERRKLDADGQAPRARASGDGSAFRPVVEAGSRPSAPVAIVHHAKFGEGKVVERLGDDKLRIDFGAHGIRVLAASFVTSKP